MDKNLNKKAYKDLVQKKLQSGMTKQEIFDELIQENTIGKELAKIIQAIPSKEALITFRGLHNLFLALLIILILLLLITLDYAGIFWSCAMIYLVISKNSRYYGWAVIPALYGFTPGLEFILRPLIGRESLFITLGIIYILVSSVITILGFYLSRKLTPNYIESKESYEDEEGNLRYRLAIRFKD